MLTSNVDYQCWQPILTTNLPIFTTKKYLSVDQPGPRDVSWPELKFCQSSKRRVYKVFDAKEIFLQKFKENWRIWWVTYVLAGELSTWESKSLVFYFCLESLTHSLNFSFILESNTCFRGTLSENIWDASLCFLTRWNYQKSMKCKEMKEILFFLLFHVPASQGQKSYMFLRELLFI